MLTEEVSQCANLKYQSSLYDSNYCSYKILLFGNMTFSYGLCLNILDRNLYAVTSDSVNVFWPLFYDYYCYW